MSHALGGFDPRATYSAAADDYDRASRRYWEFLSDRTVQRLDLTPGQAVLDLACGLGPATIAAARRVAPHGRVVAVDYAAGMLEVARRRVAASGVTGVELQQGDMLALPFGEEFDAVICVLGIFFVEDMAAAARAMWSHVRPGGTLSVTTFGAEVWTPMLEVFLDAARLARPDIEIILPWRRTEDPDVLVGALAEGGVEGVRVEQQMDRIPFQAADWPMIVMGSALRRVVVDLGEQAASVLAGNDHWARDHQVSTLGVSATYAMAVKRP